jgi:hypothetical protein
MVDKRSRTRQRRAPSKSASSKKAPLKNARAPENEQAPTVGQNATGAKALREADPASELEALMLIPGFRGRVIQSVVQKLC